MKQFDGQVGRLRVGGDAIRPSVLTSVVHSHFHLREADALSYSTSTQNPRDLEFECRHAESCRTKQRTSPS